MSTVPPHDRDDRNLNDSTDPAVNPDARPGSAQAGPLPGAESSESYPAYSGDVPEPASAAPEPATAPAPSTGGDRSNIETSQTETLRGASTETVNSGDPAEPDHRANHRADPVSDHDDNVEAAATTPRRESIHRSSTTSSVDPPANTTGQLPTEEDDAALREERARRFGRGSAPRDEESPVAYSEPTVAEETRIEPAPVPVAQTPPPEQDDPFSDWDEGPASRAAAHWWGILIGIVFTPVAWYLVTDGGNRVAIALERNLEAVHVGGLLELAGGLVCTIVLLLAARWSSVGSIVAGTITTLIGVAFVAIPSIVAGFLTAQAGVFDRLGQFGVNVHDYLVAEGHAGRILLYGIVLILVGIISHGARRQGRREERRRAALEN